MTPGACPAVQPPLGWEWPVIAGARRTLANGLRVIQAENHTVPLVWMTWISRGGVEWEPAELAGLATLTVVLLREGTARRSGRQITEEVDDLGADLVAGGDWSSAFLTLELLSADLAAGTDLLLDMALGATFPAAALDGKRQRRLAELARRRRQPRAIADDEFARAVYGGTPYGRPQLGTAESVQRIGAADAAAFHAAHYRPATSCLVMVGSFDSEETAERLGALALPQTDREPAADSATLPPAWTPTWTPAAGPEGGIRLVDVPRAAHTELRVGHAAPPPPAADLPALGVLNAVLGDGPSSRLSASLRQRQGLTYDVRSSYAARRGGGLFAVATSVASDAAGAALAAIEREIERLRTELVPAAELAQVKLRLLGAGLRQLQSIQGMAGALAPAALAAEPEPDLETARRALAAVDPEALRELARRHLHPERLVAVAVGPAAALQSNLRAAGPTLRLPSVSPSAELVGGAA